MRILHSRKLVFVSKPRCGSTSIRFLLNKLARPGDVLCDTVDSAKGMHPHMSAPAIKALLARDGYDPEEYAIFTVTRHPIAMLWSYYKFFEPDENGRYNYSENHDAQRLQDFPDWIRNGHVGIGKYWSKYIPPFVNDKDFSPLSLEAHILDENEKEHVDKWFSIEQPDEIQEWLSDVLGEKVTLGRVNASDDRRSPDVPDEVLENLRRQFPMESEFYGM